MDVVQTLVSALPLPLNLFSRRLSVRPAYFAGLRHQLSSASNGQ
jgi:hypothetical protein